jgi:hypothetical protein
MHATPTSFAILPSHSLIGHYENSGIGKAKTRTVLIKYYLKTEMFQFLWMFKNLMSYSVVLRSIIFAVPSLCPHCIYTRHERVFFHSLLWGNALGFFFTAACYDMSVEIPIECIFPVRERLVFSIFSKNCFIHLSIRIAIRLLQCMLVMLCYISQIYPAQMLK